MAPPVNRRTGYSRRAQFGTFIGYVAGVAGAVVGGWFLVSAVSNQTSYSWLRSAAGDVTAPVGAAASGLRGGMATAAETVAGYATWGTENARLKREVAFARIHAAEDAGIRAENLRLKALLGLATQNPKPVANAWLIASTATSLRRFATISAGRAQGVQSGMPVRTAQGLIGRVLEVGTVSARVLLLTDTESVVPVRRAVDGTPAFATGRGDGTLQIRLLTLGLNPLHRGDAFLASGSGGIYWPGTPIAVVTALTHDGAVAQVLADPADSEAVTVQPAWDPVEDATLPPPTPTVPPPPAAKPRSKIKKAGKPGLITTLIGKVTGTGTPPAAPAPAPAHHP